MSDVLSALDAAFLELEQENDGVLMSIGGVMVFDPPPRRKTPSLREVRERVGSVDVAEILLDRHPNAAASTRRLTAQPGTANQTRWMAPQLIAQAVGASRQGAEVALRAVLHPREAVARARSLTGLIVHDELLAAPASSINVPIGSSRRFAVVSVPMAELKAIRGALGGSVNDVVLAACTNGLRKLLLERSEHPPVRGLRAMVPINTREASERAATGATTMLDLAALAPPVLHAVLARSLYATRLFNLTITNVPGPPQPLYALGSRLREVEPVVPLAAEHAVGVAAFSYAGTMTFGVIADATSTPDIAVLACGIEEGVEQLLKLVPDAVHGRTTEQART